MFKPDAQLKIKKWNANTLYEEAYDAQAYEYMAGDKSHAALAAFFGVTEQTIYRWKKEHPSFKEAVEAGRAAGQAFVEDEARQNMHDKSFNTSLYIFKMKSQYKVRDESTTKALLGINTEGDPDRAREFVNSFSRDSRSPSSLEEI